MMGELWIVTGEIGAGKTRWCQQFLGLARQAGWDAAGIISPAVFENGLKVAIDAVDVRSGERRRLATRCKTEDTVLIHTREWLFETDTMTWGNTIFRRLSPCDLLIVDEVGPLELLEGQGWGAALEAIASRAYRLALVVVRPSLLPIAEKWQPQAVITVRHTVQ
jgi:nucleoside-triphosphatase THEP1